MKRTWVILGVLFIQIASAMFFVADILSSFFGFSSTFLPWNLREVLEVLAAFGLFVGVALGVYVLRRAILDRNHAQLVLRRASSAFMQMFNERLAEWGLTPAERDVALFAIKGMSTAEIAALRSTSEGTIKAQTNAIYRKAGVTGRAQLISLFIEDLIDQTPDTAAQPEARGADQISAA